MGIFGKLFGFVGQLGKHERYKRRLIELSPDDGHDLTCAQLEERASEAVGIALDACCPATCLMGLAVASRLKADAVEDDEDKATWSGRATRLLDFVEYVGGMQNEKKGGQGG